MHLAGTLIQSQFKVHLIHMCNSEYQKNVESIQDETFQSIQKGWYNLCKKMFKWTGTYAKPKLHYKCRIC